MREWPEVGPIAKDIGFAAGRSPRRSPAFIEPASPGRTASLNASTTSSAVPRFLNTGETMVTSRPGVREVPDGGRFARSSRALCRLDDDARVWAIETVLTRCPTRRVALVADRGTPGDFYQAVADARRAGRSISPPRCSPARSIELESRSAVIECRSIGREAGRIESSARSFESSARSSRVRRAICRVRRSIARVRNSTGRAPSAIG